MKEEKLLLTPLQTAFNEGVNAAKTVIKEHPTEDYCEFDYWRASLLNAIARKVNPYSYNAAPVPSEQVSNGCRFITTWGICGKPRWALTLYCVDHDHDMKQAVQRAASEQEFGEGAKCGDCGAPEFGTSESGRPTLYVHASEQEVTPESLAEQIRDEFALDMMVGTADDLDANFEDAVRRALEAGIEASHAELKERVQELETTLVNIEGRLSESITVGDLLSDQVYVMRLIRDLASTARAALSKSGE